MRRRNKPKIVIEGNGPQSRVELAEELHERGFTYREIAAQLGYSDASGPWRAITRRRGARRRGPHWRIYAQAQDGLLPQPYSEIYDVGRCSQEIADLFGWPRDMSERHLHDCLAGLLAEIDLAQKRKGDEKWLRQARATLLQVKEHLREQSR